MTVLVLRTSEIQKTKEFFESLGMVFVEEKHGNGPTHWAYEKDGKVLEIYPEGSKGPGVFFPNMSS